MAMGAAMAEPRGQRSGNQDDLIAVYVKSVAARNRGRRRADAPQAKEKGALPAKRNTRLPPANRGKAGVARNLIRRRP